MFFSSESIGHKNWVVPVSRAVKWQLLGLSGTLVCSEWGIHYLPSLNKSSPGQPLCVRYPVETTLCASVFLNHGEPLASPPRTIQGLLTFRDKCCLRRKDYTSVFFALLFCRPKTLLLRSDQWLSASRGRNPKRQFFASQSQYRWAAGFMTGFHCPVIPKYSQANASKPLMFKNEIIPFHWRVGLVCDRVNQAFAHFKKNECG